MKEEQEMLKLIRGWVKNPLDYTAISISPDPNCSEVVSKIKIAGAVQRFRVGLDINGKNYPGGIFSIVAEYFESLFPNYKIFGALASARWLDSCPGKFVRVIDVLDCRAKNEKDLMIFRIIKETEDSPLELKRLASLDFPKQKD